MAQQAPRDLLPLHLVPLVRLGLRLQLQGQLVRQELQVPPGLTPLSRAQQVPLVVALVPQVLQVRLQRLLAQLVPPVLKAPPAQPAQLLL
jgi:hypothetical protein